MLFVPALALAFGACEAPLDAAPAIAGTGAVSVVRVRFVPSNESGPGFAASNVTYVIATVALANTTAHDFTPAIDRFFLTAPGNARYAGVDSGSSVFAGVSNPHRMLKQGDTRTYTVGFRTTDPLATGAVSYEP
jgi:hypothetical protein